MRVLTDKWEDGYLDYALLEQQIRIKTAEWTVIDTVTGQFAEHKRSVRLLYNYWKAVGLKYVVMKVISRLKEANRNKKYIAFGYGEIIESRSTDHKTGEFVYFMTTNSPQLLDYPVIDAPFVLKGAPILPKDFDTISFSITTLPQNILTEINDYKGYSAYSQNTINTPKLAGLLRKLIPFLEKSTPTATKYPHTNKYQIQLNTALPATTNSRKPTAVVLGWGQYAKVCLSPNIQKSINLIKIHEIDPLQLGNDLVGKNIAYDTQPNPNTDENFDVYFAAGYHHTHTEIAVFALERQKYAVVEKPLATTWQDYNTLKSHVATTQKLFGCFHKRYSPFNKEVLRDFGIKKTGDTPICYYTTVFEVPLPELHWYNWSSACSRIVSNGCHWIDHFLWFNDYEPVTKMGLNVSTDLRDMVLFLEIASGATFNMVLTDKGSPSIGVRDYIELRANGATIKMTDSESYEYESAEGIKRHLRINKVRSYNDMYAIISEKINKGEQGDDPKMLYSTEIMLRFEDLFLQEMNSRLNS